MASTKLVFPGQDNYFVQEAIKTLRTNLQFCGQSIRVISFTSCDENEGKTTIVLHTAKSFSDLGKRVLVIDADLRRSVMAGRNASVRRPFGLSELLTGMAPLNECLYQSQFQGLDILFAGKYPPNPVELLNGQNFLTLIQEARKVYDYILIDTPPLGRVIDAAVIAPACDGTVMVIGNQRISRRQAQEVVNQIKKSGTQVLGVVRNNTQKKDSYYYRDAYGSH